MAKKKLDELNDDFDIGKKNELGSVFAVLFKKIPIKLSLFLFIIYLFISSDIYRINILEKFNDTLDGTCPSTRGYIINGIILILLFIIIYMLVESKVI